MGVKRHNLHEINIIRKNQWYPRQSQEILNPAQLSVRVKQIGSQVSDKRHKKSIIKEQKTAQISWLREQVVLIANFIIQLYKKSHRKILRITG